MRKKYITLLESDQGILEGMLLKRSLTVTIHKRVESLLLLNSGLKLVSVMQQVGLTYPTLKTLISRYEESGLDCLKDKSRSGRPIGISGEERAKITALACSKAPEGHVRWTLRLLADKVVELGICAHLSHVHAGKILKKTSYSLILNTNGALERGMRLSLLIWNAYCGFMLCH